MYKKAWENHDENLLKLIFHPNALYYEKPFHDPLRGIEEILEYWRYNAKVQRNVKFNVLREIQNKNQIIAEWLCEFDRIDSRKHLVLQGVLWADLKKSKIECLTEYFLQKISN